MQLLLPLVLLRRPDGSAAARGPGCVGAAGAADVVLPLRVEVNQHREFQQVRVGLGLAFAAAGGGGGTRRRRRCDGRRCEEHGVVAAAEETLADLEHGAPGGGGGDRGSGVVDVRPGGLHSRRGLRVVRLRRGEHRDRACGGHAPPP